jgi:transposase
MARSGPLLTEARWKKIAFLLPQPPKQRKGGRPWIENRRVLEGILWILRSGARWQDLPGTPPIPRRAGGDCGTGTSRASG